MICVGISDTLYPGGTLGANSCIVCAGLPLLYAPVVTLHSMRMTLTDMIFIGWSDAYHLFGCNVQDVENPNNGPMLSGLVKFIRYAHLISLLMVLSLPRSTMERSPFSSSSTSSSSRMYSSPSSSTLPFALSPRRLLRIAAFKYALIARNS